MCGQNISRRPRSCRMSSARRTKAAATGACSASRSFAVGADFAGQAVQPERVFGLSWAGSTADADHASSSSMNSLTVADWKNPHRSAMVLYQAGPPLCVHLSLLIISRMLWLAVLVSAVSLSATSSLGGGRSFLFSRQSLSGQQPHSLRQDSPEVWSGTMLPSCCAARASGMPGLRLCSPPGG